MLGLHATPVPSGLAQSPLAAIRLRQAPESIASFPRRRLLLVDRLWPDFPTHVFLSCLSHLAVPAVDSSHSLAFDSLRRVKSTTCSVCTLPLTHSGRVRTPWPPTACARILDSSRCSVAGAALWSVWSGHPFLSCSPISEWSASPSRASLPLIQALRHCNRSAPVSPGRLLGLQATPVPSGLAQNPLAAIHLRQALESIVPSLAGGYFWSTGCGPTFRLTSSCRASHTSRMPAVDSSHSLAFDSLRRVKSATYSVCTLPLTHSGRVRTPWPPTACARLLDSSRYSVAGAASGRFQVRPPFPRLFTGFRVVCFSLTGVLTVNPGLTTLLSITLRRCRPAASSVWMLPLSLQAGQYSPVLPGLLSSAPELVRLSSIARFPSSDFQPHGSQDLTGLVDASGSVTRRMLWSAYYPCCFERKTPRA